MPDAPDRTKFGEYTVNFAPELRYDASGPYMLVQDKHGNVAAMRLTPEQEVLHVASVMRRALLATAWMAPAPPAEPQT